MAKLDLKQKIRKVPDFPREGVLYYDITTLLKEAHTLRYVVNEMINYYIEHDLHFDKVVSAESRGFIFGAILANELHAGFVPLRKPGKLPAKTIKQEYELEYGTDSIEIHEDGIDKGDSVLIVDDLLATGGTALAATKLVKKLKGNIKNLTFLVELEWLGGRKKLKGHNIFSLIKYEKPDQ